MLVNIILQNYVSLQVTCTNGLIRTFNNTDICTCKPGFIANGTSNSYNCIECTLNTYSPGGNATVSTGSCLACSVSGTNYQAPTYDHSYCQQCQNGIYTVNTQNICKCNEGFYLVSEQIKCIQCQQNYFLTLAQITASSTPITCNACGQQYVSNYYNTFCVCPDGFTGTSCSAVQSTQIAFNQYQNESTSLVSSCNNGSINTELDNTCKCNANFHVDFETHECVACEENTYQINNNYTKYHCLDCPLFMKWNSDSICACDVGFYYNSTHQYCYPCKDSQYKTTIDNSTMCENCYNTTSFTVTNYKHDHCQCYFNTNNITRYYTNSTACTQSASSSYAISWNSVTHSESAAACASSASILVDQRTCVCTNGKHWVTSGSTTTCTTISVSNQTAAINGSDIVQCPIGKTRISGKQGCQCDQGLFWNNTKCSPCPDYTFVGTISTTTENTCACNNTVSVSNYGFVYNYHLQKYVCQCTVFNKYLNTETNTCTECPVGTYNDLDQTCKCGTNKIINENQECMCPENTMYVESSGYCEICQNQQVRLATQSETKCYTKYEENEWNMEQ